MSTIAYIGLGSNLGDSRQILTQAVSRLSTLGPVKFPGYIRVRLWGLKTSRIIIMP